MTVLRYLPVGAAAIATSAALTIPALGASSDPPALGDPPANLAPVPPPTPAPEPGETQIPPVGDASEDDLPTTPAQRSAALEHLTDVARCAREHGLAVPNPVSDSDGVTLSLPGGPSPAVEAVLAACAPEGAALPDSGPRASSRGGSRRVSRRAGSRHRPLRHR